MFSNSSSGAKRTYEFSELLSVGRVWPACDCECECYDITCVYPLLVENRETIGNIIRFAIYMNYGEKFGNSVLENVTFPIKDFHTCVIMKVNVCAFTNTHMCFYAFGAKGSEFSACIREFS